MAYLVGRRDGRFEIRESIHTPSGPRARSLANFAVLTEEVLAKAAGRAHRFFDRRLVLDAARRRGAPIAGVVTSGYDAWVASSRRLAAGFEREEGARHLDPGRSLIELAQLVDALPPGRRRPGPLEYPVLSRLVGD